MRAEPPLFTIIPVPPLARLLLVALLTLGCIRPTGPRETIVLDAARVAGEETVRWLAHTHGLSHSAEITRLLKRVVARLDSAAQTFSPLPAGISRRPSDHWKVLAIRSSEPNAFATTGHTIIVTEGLLRTLSNEAQLAAVISHEMSHTLLGHPLLYFAESIRNQERSPPTTSPTLHYSLEEELEADALALRIVHAARYDLREVLSALSIGYRSRAGRVSIGEDGPIVLRKARLIAAMKEFGNFLPATRDSREFQRVRRTLLVP